MAGASSFVLQPAKAHTPIHLAASYDCNKMIEALHKHGAELEETNREGKTPLQIAKEKDHKDAIAILQRLGARR